MTNMNHPRCASSCGRAFYSPCIWHISVLKKHPNMQRLQMINERGGHLPETSNQCPLPTGCRRRRHVQEAFSQDHHVLNRLSPPQIFMAEIYSLIFHYLLPLLCIQEEPLAATATLHRLLAVLRRTFVLSIWLQVRPATLAEGDHKNKTRMHVLDSLDRGEPTKELFVFGSARVRD